MPFHTINTKKLAAKYQIDISVIEAKHKLIEDIKLARIRQGLSQFQLGQKMGKSQSFVAKIESGIGTRNFSFDLLLKFIF